MSKTEMMERIDLLESRLESVVKFLEPLAIGSEQIWEVVFNDILDRPVPDGIDLREEIKSL